MLQFGWSPLVLSYSKFSSPFTKPFGIVSSTPITIAILVTFMFHSLFVFNSLARSTYLSLFSIFFKFYSVVSRDVKVHSSAGFLYFFLLTIIIIIIKNSICSIGCLNIHGNHVTANESTSNNAVFFFVSDLKIIYYNNNQFSITMPWTREEKYFASLLISRQNHSKLSRSRCNQ